MQQKVWVINDDDWGLTPGKQITSEQPRKSRVAEPSPIEKEKVSESHCEPARKNPALSFSLSLLVWGGGQMYIGKYRLGAIYMASMVLFCSVFSVLALFWESIGHLDEDIILQMPLLIIAAMVFFMIGLVCWSVNAVDAYCRAIRLRPEPYLGVDNELWPLSCSLLFPGWGQFLNAQPVRGGIFLLFGMLGIFSVLVLSVAWHVWPFLNVSPVNYLFEICMVSALLYIPFAFLIWVVAAYDAFVSCYRGEQYALVPRSSAVLGLLLAISVGMQVLPEGYYLAILDNARLEMLNSNMKIIPELARKASEFIGR